jgi:5-methylcytosine-specific restriction protein A
MTALHKTNRWKMRAKQQLRNEPLCNWCLQRGLMVIAEVAHHVERHEGNPVIFWSSPLVSLCKRCHDSDAQSLEKTGKPKQVIGVDGWPLPPIDHKATR